MRGVSRERGFTRGSEGVQNFVQGEFSTVFVDNLPFEIRKVWIFNLFSKFGVIREPNIPLKRSKISRNRFAFVLLDSTIERRQLMQSHKSMAHGSGATSLL